MEFIVEQRRWLLAIERPHSSSLTFLLGIQLAIVRLTPQHLPLRPFIAAILLWYTAVRYFSCSSRPPGARRSFRPNSRSSPT